MTSKMSFPLHIPDEWNLRPWLSACRVDGITDGVKGSVVRGVVSRRLAALSGRAETSGTGGTGGALTGSTTGALTGSTTGAASTGGALGSSNGGTGGALTGSG